MQRFMKKLFTSRRSRTRSIASLMAAITLCMTMSMPVLAAEPTMPALAQVGTVSNGVSQKVAVTPDPGSTAETAATSDSEDTSNTADTADPAATPRSMRGFGYKDVTNSMGSFTVYVSGNSSPCYVTIKTERFASSLNDVSVSIYRPDGSAAKRDVVITGNNEKKFNFSNAPAGTYTVSYFNPLAAPGRINAWFY